MGRILAIDYGRKKSGVAVTDPMQIIANGLTTVSSHELFDFIVKYMQDEEVEKIVMGYPTQTTGEVSESMKYIEPFVNRLKKNFPELPVEWVDERFTSKIAFQAMIDGGLKKKARQNKALIDKVSATIILQTYLEQKHI
ncbi:Holliday junction resolvase RuvX [Carboxylicivirga sediminis]|uniref:Putative pre-16S rRNA nuclease n=1 Tax=Carboxylicivirga sediminis TaxID=2006564 RepID=A0A941F8E7_9BACT|nr:Holliday junction resolvase RuvX [Carboxylicivirga sediminis]MBR8537608.1 Holliday junction resolvase RuvX [Carboxylicivirga sediminis]